MVLKTVLALGVKRARKGKICGEVEGHGTRAGTRCRQRTLLDPAGRPGRPPARGCVAHSETRARPGRSGRGSSGAARTTAPVRSAVAVPV